MNRTPLTFNSWRCSLPAYRRPVRLLIAAILASVCLLRAGQADAERQTERPTPLPRAHAHNDYEHGRPLLDALDHGFCSVEADIHLVEGKLLVAHDRQQVKPDRTLQSLYLEPLRRRVKANGGSVYRNGPSFTLLIDLKTDGETTYAVLRKVLEEYADVLTRFAPASTEARAITVVLSGNRPKAMLTAETVRYAGYDGRLGDLEGSDSGHLTPLVSDNWAIHFKWRGEGPIPENEKLKLKQLVAKAHEQGRKLRFWGAPDRPEVWKELFDAGVDLINTDNLAGLKKFLLDSQ
ncbi:MAG TPA: phosphatidylinositol-specific phospholipase C/glycerophosphodiester phosphodiesterase family protein [Verrucomicrobiae bacterium]|nr:phosphatidylinositol-specific phospholipase C/glycerophosphodiester phosphodiesterase family protein [Verrucomicrobiae bacterium]